MSFPFSEIFDLDIIDFMINMIKKLLSYIYIEKCYFCNSKRERVPFCSKCFNSAELSAPVQKAVVGGKTVFSAGEYSGTIKKLIKAVKFHNKKNLAVYQAKLMYKYWREIKRKKDFYTVLPIPTYSLRQRHRRFNHINLVAREFSRLAGYEYNETALKRTRYTEPLYKMTKRERAKILKDCFAFEGEISTPVLIIDDIFTTGATLNEAVKCLEKHGITDITCFTTAAVKMN